eukprot:13526321-Ditylum_brightwellii.AAC.1
MPGFVPKAPQQFQHETPKKPQYALHTWNKLAYGQKVQYAALPDTSTHLDKNVTCNTQSIVGTFLYCGRAIDGTLLPTLNKISTDQAKPTINMTKQITMHMDYLVTYPNAVLHFYARNI